MKWFALLVLCLLAVSGIAAAQETQEDTSSANLAQVALDMMGDTNQNALVAGFDYAESVQLGYSKEGKVTQTVSYDNIGSGKILQWGESGTMTKDVREYYFDSVGDTVNITNWNNGQVNQTVYLRNSEKIYLTQVVGDLKKYLLPDEYRNRNGGGAVQVQPDFDNAGWWFCGTEINGTGGLPLCALKLSQKIFQGKATARDYYMLGVLEEEQDAFPPENLTPHVTLTKWNITEVNGSLVIKFKAHNYGRKAYNATLMLDLTPKIDIPDNWISQKGKAVEFKAADQNLGEIKIPDKKVMEIGKYTVPRMKGIEEEIVVPLKDLKIKSLQMRMLNDE